jgi:hypothetical protein
LPANLIRNNMLKTANLNKGKKAEKIKSAAKPVVEKKKAKKKKK